MTIPLEPDRRRLRQGALRGVGWTSLQKVATQTTSLLTFVVLARLLVPEDFGLVALATAMVSLVTKLFDLSLSHYLVQQRQLETRVTNTAFWSAVLIATVVTAALCMGAPLAAWAFGEPRLTAIVIALAFTVLLTSFISVPVALFKRSLSFRVLSRRTVVATLVSGIVGIGLALAGAGPWALVAQAYALPVVSIVLFYGVAGWRPRFQWDRRESLAMLRYGSQLWGMSSLTFARAGGDALIIGAFLGPTNLGIYTVARRLVKHVTELFGGVVLQVVPPVLAAAKDDPDRVRRGYLAAVSTVAAVVAPVTLMLAAVSGVLVVLVFGPQWDEAGWIAQVAALGSAVAILMHFDRGLFLALDLPQVELRNTVVTTVFGLGAVAAAAQLSLGAVAVTATVWAYASWIWRLWILHRRAGIAAGTVTRALGPVWAASALCAALVWGLTAGLRLWGLSDPAAVSLGLLAGMLVYPPVLRLLAGPTVARLRHLVPAVLYRHRLVSLVLRYGLGAAPLGQRTKVPGQVR